MRVERVTEDLTRASGRAPTVAEIAARMGQTHEEVLDAREASAARHAVSLSTPAGGGEGVAVRDAGDRRREELAGHREAQAAS